MKYSELLELKSFAEKLAKDAGKILLTYQKTAKIVKYKDLQDVATTADLASEKFIIDSITKKFPTHSILSEEQGETDKNSDFEWIIDPLDGTKEYLRDIPLFNVSIALQYKEELVAAALYRPSENTLYSAAKELGAFKNGKKIKVSNKEKLEESFVYCYLPSFKRNQEKYDLAFDKLQKVGKKSYRLRALADENTALCWLAQGGIEAYLNLSNPPKKHDISTGILIAQEAGAVIDQENHPVVVTNNKKIYNELAKII
ncbi:MAG TPA: inositol monophosphatase family protein [Patescibacteria group bacterium]|nr:inositol monophosphatase family protein [Patescibacteria group bacterium]